MSGRSVSGVMSVFIAALVVAGCSPPPTSPSGDSVVTFLVGSEMYRVRLTTPEQVAAAEAARRGVGPTIPHGRLRAGSDVNAGWNWHVVDVQFVDATIALCDGLPSHVERAGPSFANGWYCPWGARVVSIDRR